MRKTATLILVILWLVQAMTPPAWAQRGGSISLVRDAETERMIRDFAAPLFSAAGLDAGFVNVHLVNDRSINAFVAGGQRVFVNTGLLLKVRNPNELIGVLAHETGHISAGHLARMQDAIRDASAIAILATVLGAAAMAAGAATGGSGAGEAGAAIMMGGQSLAMRDFLSFTRTQESAADQAAATFLDQTQQSARGLISFLKVLGAQESLLSSRQDPYVRSHPVSSERIAALEARFQQSRFRDKPDRPEDIAILARIQAKLIGFIEPFGTVMNRFPPEDQSDNARYARAHAYYRTADMGRAAAEMDALITKSPNDPYYLEFKAQILYEGGKPAEAIPYYRRSVQHAPGEPLLIGALGQAMIAANDDALLPEAIQLLENSLRLERDNSSAWQQLAIAYGRRGDIGMASLATAERMMIQNNRRDARFQADRALRLLTQGSPAWLRAQDIKNATDKTEN